MTFDQAVELIRRVVDAGFSCTLDVSVHPQHVPAVHYAVAIHQMSYDAIDLKSVIEIADGAGLCVTFINGTLRFMESKGVEVTL